MRVPARRWRQAPRRSRAPGAPVLWPDVDATVLARACLEFAARERRYGLTGEQVRA